MFLEKKKISHYKGLIYGTLAILGRTSNFGGKKPKESLGREWGRKGWG